MPDSDAYEADYPNMLIVNGGLPRSGTVLVGAIICEILRHQGRTWTRYNPQERRDMPEFAEKTGSWPFGQDALLVHTHLADVAVMRALSERADAVVFWNHRDPRDVLVSLRALHDLPLERAIAAVQIYARVEQAIRGAGLAMRLRYETFIQNPAGLVKTIATGLGVELARDKIKAIVQRTSIEQHRKVMQDIASGGVPGVRTLPTQTRDLREDPETLINDRHIQSGVEGRWRQELSDAERLKVQEALAPYVQALGYPD